MSAAAIPLSRFGRGAGVPPWRAWRAATLDPGKGQFSAPRYLAAAPRLADLRRQECDNYLVECTRLDLTVGQLHPPATDTHCRLN